MTGRAQERFHSGASRVRVTDVAQLAGCAPATVSRAINDPERVSADKRARIQKAMVELGYVRNHAARALRSQRSHMIGVLIPTLDYALYASLVGGASSLLSKAGISTLIATFEYDLKEELKEARQLLERGAEALILVGQHHDPDFSRLLDQFEVPYVSTYVRDTESNQPCVGFDNAAAAASITRHLVHLGHRRICVISGKTKDNDRTIRRLEGVKTELRQHGVEIDDSMVAECDYSISGGREACTQLLSRAQPYPTAIVCGNDILALGAIVECQSNGFRVPEDISVVGFDNIELSKHCNPPLTTIDVPADRMGSLAAGYLLDKLEGKEAAQYASVEVQLILRESTAPPPTAIDA